MYSVAVEKGGLSLTDQADVSYTAPKSLTTPLVVAVKFGRVDLVRVLLDAGARVSAKDVFGQSALFYASRSGNATLVELLLRRKPAVNDGSLHEASRGFHVQAMKLLLEAGHDPNYRSGRHGGRTALGEIARKAIVPNDVTVAEEALDLLSAVDASPLLKVQGKTVIFLALDNDNNEAVTRVLLDRMLYKTLNSLENTYQEGAYHYSPTMYVSKGILRGPRSEALVQLLKAHGAEDRFYATIEEVQPPDAVGLPEDILEYERGRRERERRNRLAEEDHINAIRREREKAQVIGQIKDEHHARDLRQREERSQQKRRHRGLDHHQAVLLQADRYYNDSQIRTNEAHLDSHLRWRRHNDDLAMLSQKRDADLLHRYQSHQQRLDERRDRARVETEARDLRHAKSLGHLREAHRQRWQERTGRRAQELEWLQRQGQPERERRAREGHETKMTELRTQRGNVIGQVNLEELRRWQEIERAERAEKAAKTRKKGFGGKLLA